ncbi:MAG: SH3 domain-containing protein [Gammaproteobacteria bacterium]|nr:SH3 domain-containing protein [Gammaproteobacteria bacterium]
MSRAHNLMKCLCVILFFSFINLASAGSDKGYMNLTMGKHTLSVNKQNEKQIIAAISQKIGQYDNKNKCYRMNIQQYQFCFNPINYTKTGVVDNDVFLMAFSGYEMTGKYGTGIFFVVNYISNEYIKGLEFSSINGIYGFGTVNQPLTKSQVKLVELYGESYVWEIKDGYTGQGETLEKIILIYETGLSDITQKKIFELNSYYDNEGLCDPQNKIKCEVKEISTKIIQNQNAQKANDIELTFTLKEDKKIIKTTNELIKFNDQTMSYVLPSNDMMKYMEQNSKEITQNKSVNSSANTAQNIFCVTGLSNQPPDNFLVLRNQPSRSSKWSQTITFKNGDRVEVLGTEGDFYKVRAGNGEIGYSGKAFILPCDKSR